MIAAHSVTTFGDAGPAWAAGEPPQAASPLISVAAMILVRCRFIFLPLSIRRARTRLANVTAYAAKRRHWENKGWRVAAHRGAARKLSDARPKLLGLCRFQQ